MKNSTKQNILKCTCAAICALSVGGAFAGLKWSIDSEAKTRDINQELNSIYTEFKSSPTYKTFTEEKIQQYTNQYSNGLIDNNVLGQKISDLDSQESIYNQMDKNTQYIVDSKYEELSDASEIGAGSCALSYLSAIGIGVSGGILSTPHSKKQEEQTM